MRRAALTLAAVLAVSAAQAREDEGAAKSPAAYLDLIPSARAAAMGYAQGAVIPREATDVINPATLALIDAQYFSATTGSMGLGRKLINAGYVFPFHWNQRDHFFRAEQNPMSTPRKEWHSMKMPAESTRYAIFLGGTSFGFGDIGGASEYGDTLGSFDDKEKNMSLALAGRPYENAAFGFNARYLQQTLPGAEATGLTLTLGLWYGAPALRWGTFDFGAGVRDTAGKFTWKVNDPDLDVSYKYKEKIASKIWVGTAFHSASARWLYTLDAVKPTEQKMRVNAGVEARLAKAFYLRAGAADFEPTVGCGVVLGRRALDVAIDYAMQPDLNSLVNVQWVTFTLRFLPVASDMDGVPAENTGHNRLDRQPRQAQTEAAPAVPKPTLSPSSTAAPAAGAPAPAKVKAKAKPAVSPARKSSRPTLNSSPRKRKKS